MPVKTATVVCVYECMCVCSVCIIVCAFRVRAATYGVSSHLNGSKKKKGKSASMTNVPTTDSDWRVRRMVT